VCRAQALDAGTAPAVDAELGELTARAVGGVAAAQYQMGVAYAQGLGVPRDHGKAVYWYRLAAAQGYAAAMNNLGVLLLTGTGDEASDAEAVRLFRSAAQRHNVPAQNNLAWMYEQGRGVTRDLHRAYMWLRVARSSSWGGSEFRDRDNRLALVDIQMLREEIRSAEAMARACLEKSLLDCD